ncbi:MAG: hypothetical protein ACYSTL_00845 [Planctomycetota bacterium]|jgi:hypothetical protein
MMDYNSIADDFFVNLDLQTTLELPDSRETILLFCEAVQKEFREMTSFYRREEGQFVLEGDRTSGSYPWMELQSNRLSAGYFNPPDIAAAYRLHGWLLDRCVYFLGIGGLDVEALDVMFGFNLDYCGNRDEIVSETLLGGSPLAAFVEEHPRRAIEFEPSLVLTLSEDCYTQGRLAMETRCDSYQVRTGNYEREPISAYFTVRRYPSPEAVVNLQESFAQQCEIGEEIVSRIVIPNVVQPLAAAIAAAQ